MYSDLMTAEPLPGLHKRVFHATELLFARVALPNIQIWLCGPLSARAAVGVNCWGYYFARII